MKLALEFPAKLFASGDYGGTYLTRPERDALAEAINSGRIKLPVRIIDQQRPRELWEDVPYLVPDGHVTRAMVDAATGNLHFDDTALGARDGWEFGCVTYIKRDSDGQVTEREVVAAEYGPANSFDRWKD